MFGRMVVAGVGLIGGSLAMAARKRNLVEEVVGYGRGRENLRLAQREGIIDAYFLRPKDFPKGADLLILATPVQATVSLTASFLPALEPGCLISDVGSVKGKIVREMEKLVLPRHPFVGSHPIAGGERWGAKAALPDLFSGQRCIMTPTRLTDPSALKKMTGFWRRLGAKVEIMDPDLHDRILAVVSHLPHVVAYTLVNLLSEAKADSVDLKEYCGGGFRDLTRIASSRPEIWRDICLTNRRAISKSLQEYIQSLKRVRRWIDAGAGELLEREFVQANVIRSQIA